MLPPVILCNTMHYCLHEHNGASCGWSYGATAHPNITITPFNMNVKSLQHTLHSLHFFKVCPYVATWTEPLSF